MTRKQPTSPNEIRALLGPVERDREQARIAGLHLDGEFGFLYNVALQLATRVLRPSGLRVGQTAHHKDTFGAVADLVPEEFASAVACFDRARRKRNVLTYDQAGIVTKADVEELRASIDAFEIWVRGQAEAYLNTTGI